MLGGWFSSASADLKSCTTCTLAVLGALFALRIGYEVFSYLWLHLLRPKTNLKKYGARKNGDGASWAVVTGCTNGIGEGFVHVLAQRGFNVVLISRNEQLLQALATGVEGKYGVKTAICVVDCTTATSADYARLNTTLSSLPGTAGLSLVINNVGVNRTETPSELSSMTDDDVDAMITVNCRFHTKFTKLCIPLLQKRDTSVAPRGAIVHLSSFSGVFPAGLMSLYSGTKSFADAFGRALHSELSTKRGGSIDSLSVVAHYVVSNMSGFDRPSMGVPTPQTFAKATLNKLGAGAQLVPHWHHDLMARIIASLPSSYVAQKGFEMMVKVRKAHLDPAKAEKRKARKEAAEAKKADERAKFASSASTGGKKAE